MSMTTMTRSLSLALALGLLGLTATAQETTTEAPAEAPAADAPAADAPAAADDLSMGTVPNAPPAPKTKDEAAVGEIYLAATFDSWEQRCEKTEDGKDPCQLFQLLKDSEGYPVAEFSLSALPAGGQAVAGATIVAPLETLLTANLGISIDDGKGKIYPFTFCTQFGCVARVGFTADEVAGFKKGAKATMTIVPAAAPTEKVQLDISLKGFTAGYDAVAATLPQ